MNESQLLEYQQNQNHSIKINHDIGNKNNDYNQEHKNNNNNNINNNNNNNDNNTDNNNNDNNNNDNNNNNNNLGNKNDANQLYLAFTSLSHNNSISSASSSSSNSISSSSSLSSDSSFSSSQSPIHRTNLNENDDNDESMIDNVDNFNYSTQTSSFTTPSHIFSPRDSDNYDNNNENKNTNNNMTNSYPLSYLSSSSSFSSSSSQNESHIRQLTFNENDNNDESMIDNDDTSTSNNFSPRVRDNSNINNDTTIELNEQSFQSLSIPLSSFSSASSYSPLSSITSLSTSSSSIFSPPEVMRNNKNNFMSSSSSSSFTPSITISSNNLHNNNTNQNNNIVYESVSDSDSESQRESESESGSESESESDSENNNPKNSSQSKELSDKIIAWYHLFPTSGSFNINNERYEEGFKLLENMKLNETNISILNPLRLLVNSETDSIHFLSDNGRHYATEDDINRAIMGVMNSIPKQNNTIKARMGVKKIKPATNNTIMIINSQLSKRYNTIGTIPKSNVAAHKYEQTLYKLVCYITDKLKMPQLEKNSIGKSIRYVYILAHEKYREHWSGLLLELKEGVITGARYVDSLAPGNLSGNNPMCEWMVNWLVDNDIFEVKKQPKYKKIKRKEMFTFRGQENGVDCGFCQVAAIVTVAFNIQEKQSKRYNRIALRRRILVDSLRKFFDPSDYSNNSL